MAKSGKGVLYLDRNRIDLYEDVTGRLLSTTIPLNLINDLEVLNAHDFQTFISTFIDQNKIIPTQLICVASSAILFEKIISPTAGQEVEIRKFLDMLPFENTSFKLFQTEKGVKVVTVSLDFYEAFKQAFEKRGFVVTLIIPGFVITGAFDGKRSLDTPAAQTILNKHDLIKQYGLVSKSTKNVKEDDSKNLKSAKKPLLSLPILLNIFFLLVGVGSTLVITQVLNKNVTTSSSAAQVSPTISQPRPSVNPTQLISPSPIMNVQGLTVQLQSSEKTASLSSSLKLLLAQKGIDKIDEIVNTNNVSQTPLILFNSKLPIEIQKSFADAIKQIIPTISFQQTTDSQYDISVLLGAP